MATTRKSTGKSQGKGSAGAKAKGRSSGGAARGAAKKKATGGASKASSGRGGAKPAGRGGAAKPDSALAAVVGDSAMARSEITKRLWDYIKKQGLQDQANKRQINADDTLQAVFGGKKSVTMFEIAKFVNQHVSQ